MQQEAADKLDGIYGCLLCLTGIPIFIREGYFSVFKRQEAIVGNGNPMGIAREIFEYIFRFLNGVSDIYYPVASITAVHQLFEPGGSSQRSGLARESEGSTFDPY